MGPDVVVILGAFIRTTSRSTPSVFKGRTRRGGFREDPNPVRDCDVVVVVGYGLPDEFLGSV